jgi:hypothetical protein
MVSSTGQPNQDNHGRKSEMLAQLLGEYIIISTNAKPENYESKLLKR